MLRARRIVVMRPDAGRAAPLVEYVEHVRLAEIDLHRPSPRPAAIVAFEIAIDAGAGDLQRHAALGPSGHQVEGWSDDANQVAVVLPAEIPFDLSTEISDLHCYVSTRAAARAASDPGPRARSAGSRGQSRRPGRRSPRRSRCRRAPATSA